MHKRPRRASKGHVVSRDNRLHSTRLGTARHVWRHAVPASSPLEGQRPGEARWPCPDHAAVPGLLGVPHDSAWSGNRGACAAAPNTAIQQAGPHLWTGLLFTSVQLRGGTRSTPPPRSLQLHDAGNDSRFHDPRPCQASSDTCIAPFRVSSSAARGAGRSSMRPCLRRSQSPRPT
jgi:hypothetical protein